MRQFYKQRVLFGFVFVLLWGLLTSSLVLAQETRGSIVGKVVDQSGGVVAKATMIVTNKAMGTKVSLVTNDQGF